MLSVAVALAARRTGQGLGWQMSGLCGLGLAVLALVLPVDQWIGGRARWAESLALALGVFAPAILLVVLSVKRWPGIPATQRPLESLQ
ncbi:MAG: hypothetical protein WAT25_19290 [Paracoccaceae bacterium]